VRFFAASNGALLAATQDIGPQPSRVALMELHYRSPTVFIQPSRDLPHRRYAARAVRSFQDGGDRTIGVVEVSRSTHASERFLTTLRHILLVTILAAVVTSLLVSVLLARRLSGPIRDMEQATRRIAAGDLDVRLGDYPPDEMGRLAESINHMTAQLKHLEAARAQFISEISHDLRTPLTAIKGLLVNLIDASGPGEQPSASSAGLQIRRKQWKGEQTSLEIAERETDRLIRLVNQLLDFSRWQGGQLELNRRPVDVSAIARAAVTLSEGRAHHRNITLNTDIPLLDGRRACPERSRRAPTEPASLPTISADPDRLQQVILNLLDNAIKFTPSGGQVTLAVTQREGGALSGSTEPSSRAQAEGLAEVLSRGEIEVSVQDTGRGMSRGPGHPRVVHPSTGSGLCPSLVTIVHISITALSLAGNICVIYWNRLLGARNQVFWLIRHLLAPQETPKATICLLRRGKTWHRGCPRRPGDQPPGPGDGR